MRVFIIAVALFLAACASDISPPDFPGGPSDPNARSCGGIIIGASQACGPGEYCHRSVADMCGAADAPGVCRMRPQICTMDYNPVCGCDGQSYPNECGANANGISAAANGACR